MKDFDFRGSKILPRKNTVLFLIFDIFILIFIFLRSRGHVKNFRARGHVMNFRTRGHEGTQIILGHEGTQIIVGHEGT